MDKKEPMLVFSASWGGSKSHVFVVPRGVSLCGLDKEKLAVTDEEFSPLIQTVTCKTCKNILDGARQVKGVKFTEFLLLLDDEKQEWYTSMREAGIIIIKQFMVWYLCQRRKG